MSPGALAFLEQSVAPDTEVCLEKPTPAMAAESVWNWTPALEVVVLRGCGHAPLF